LACRHSSLFLEKKLPSTSWAWTSSSLGYKELEHGCEASRKKSTKINCWARRMAREGVP
jgi:hypothetical protein